MIILVEFIDQAIKWIQDSIINPFSNWIEGLIPALKGYGPYVFYGLVGLVVVILLLIIIISIAKSRKKKKLLKQAQQAIDAFEALEVPEEAKEEKVAEVEPTNEVKEEAPSLVVEDTQEEVIETVQEEPEEVVAVADDKVEDKVEEDKVEETPEPVKKEVKKTTVSKKKSDEVTLTPEEIALAKEMVKQVNAATKKTTPAKKEKVEEKEPVKKAGPAKKKEEKEPKRSREKTGPKEIDLNFTPDRVIPEAVAEESVKEEPKVVEPVKKTAPIKAKVEEPIKSVSSKEEKKGTQGKYILVREGETNWRYKLKASNGEILIVSEPYTSEKSVRTGIETLNKNLDNLKIDFVEDKHGLFYFMILTKQGRCLATSASYKTKASALSASKSYNRWATTDIITASDEDSEHSEVEEIKIEIEEVNTGKFVIQKENNGFLYQLLAANGVVVATSQIYKSKDSCIEACETFRRCVYKGSFFISRDKNDLYQFKLYNKQNRLVLAGEVYKEKSRAISVIETIKKLARLASLVDNTNQ